MGHSILWISFLFFAALRPFFFSTKQRKYCTESLSVTSCCEPSFVCLCSRCWTFQRIRSATSAQKLEQITSFPESILQFLCDFQSFWYYFCNSFKETQRIQDFQSHFVVFTRLRSANNKLCSANFWGSMVIVSVMIAQPIPTIELLSMCPLRPNDLGRCSACVIRPQAGCSWCSLSCSGIHSGPTTKASVSSTLCGSEAFCCKVFKEKEKKASSNAHDSVSAFTSCPDFHWHRVLCYPNMVDTVKKAIQYNYAFSACFESRYKKTLELLAGNVAGHGVPFYKTRLWWNCLCYVFPFLSYLQRKDSWGEVVYYSAVGHGCTIVTDIITKQILPKCCNELPKIFLGICLFNCPVPNCKICWRMFPVVHACGDTGMWCITIST